MSPQLVPFFIVGMWLAITTSLSWMSRWYRLQAAFPNRRHEGTYLRIGSVSGTMHGVRMRNILRLTACEGGLRIAIFRVFGPFNRPFFVPWHAITVRRTTPFFQAMAVLEFGIPPIGRLAIPASIANRLAASANGQWPERSAPRPETHAQFARRLFARWAMPSTIAFVFVAICLAASHAPFTVYIMTLFPGIVLALGGLVTYFRDRPKRDV